MDNPKKRATLGTQNTVGTKKKNKKKQKKPTENYKDEQHEPYQKPRLNLSALEG